MPEFQELLIRGLLFLCAYIILLPIKLMNPLSQIPGTPKEQLRAIRILFAAIIIGAMLFAIVMAVLDKVAQGALAPETRKYADLFLYIASGFAFICLVVAFSSYRKSMAAAKDALIPLPNKLNLYRAALVRYIAVCEGAALFSIIAFFLTGNYNLFLITAVMIAAMLWKTPTRQRVKDELALDWQQQQELE